MRLLFTGASSFTGYWFIRALAEAGHEVVAPLRSHPAIYEGVRRKRIEKLSEICTLVPSVPFGSPEMIDLIETGGPWDLFAHHAADVTNYKSPDFDPISALQNNAHALVGVLDALKVARCRHLLLTGSVFEQGEGREGGAAFSPYGLSKGLTSDLFAYYAERAGVVMGKFVIPNPFGPYEEPRFTAYLVRSWFEGKVPKVATPDYLRDNIHVSLLAAAYRAFAERLIQSSEPLKIGPSGYAESQGAFALRLAEAMDRRLPVSCRVELGVQTDFSEPRARTNPDRLEGLSWSEEQAWDELAAYYKEQFQP